MNRIIFFLGFSLLSAIFITGCGEGNNQNEITNTLIDNLGNLNGEWGYKSKKDDEIWKLKICYNSESKSGTYILMLKNESWGGSTDNKLKITSQGKFSLAEGYDTFGDKAYVATNSDTEEEIFVIVGLENRFATDWSLEVASRQREMFGSGMTKISNDCK